MEYHDDNNDQNNNGSEILTSCPSISFQKDVIHHKIHILPAVPTNTI
jgi:hypothetical protein